MHKLSNVLSKTNKYQTNITNSLNNYNISYRTTDLVIIEAGNVINPNPNYRKWYCRKAYKLGRQKFLDLASTARADNDYEKYPTPQKLFTHLLNNA